MDNLKILAGSSLEFLESDDEDTDDFQDEASIQYDILEFVDSIGTLTFRETYLNTIHILIGSDSNHQKFACDKIITKIYEVFEYEFIPKIDLENQNNINNLYSFLLFIDFGSIDFLSDIWKVLEVNLKEINVKEYCEKNSDKIMTEIEHSSDSSNLNEFITNFLRTYKKDGLINWFIGNTEKYKMLIVLEIMKKNEDNRNG